jgi:hypothetical protein
VASNQQRGTARKRQPTPPTVELIVKRGALRRFDRLKKATADLPVTVSWDRRLAERRRTSEDVDGDRRRTDRRQKAPFTWDTADFVVVAKRRTEKPRRTRVKSNS